MTVEEFKRLLLSCNFDINQIEKGSSITRISEYEYTTADSLSTSTFILIDFIEWPLQIVGINGSTLKVSLNIENTIFPLNSTKGYYYTNSDFYVYEWILYKKAKSIEQNYIITLEEAFELIQDERYRLSLIYGINTKSPFIEIDGITITKRRNVNYSLQKEYLKDKVWHKWLF